MSVATWRKIWPISFPSMDTPIILTARNSAWYHPNIYSFAMSMGFACCFSGMPGR